MADIKVLAVHLFAVAKGHIRCVELFNIFRRNYYLKLLSRAFVDILVTRGIVTGVQLNFGLHATVPILIEGFPSADAMMWIKLIIWVHK